MITPCSVIICDVVSGAGSVAGVGAGAGGFVEPVPLALTLQARSRARDGASNVAFMEVSCRGIEGGREPTSVAAPPGPRFERDREEPDRDAGCDPGPSREGFS